MRNTNKDVIRSAQNWLIEQSRLTTIAVNWSVGQLIRHRENDGAKMKQLFEAALHLQVAANHYRFDIHSLQHSS